MNLDETRRYWHQVGRDDPLWAILTIPDRANNRWDVDEFLQIGRDEIDDVMHRLQEMDIDVAKHRCLDFGCGVGRLTQALCRYFDRCDGVDIAESMINRANDLNRHPDSCTYHLNMASDLSLFGDCTFDFIYSKAVLQHMHPKYSLAYIREFVRILTPRGLAVFDLPSAYIPLGPLPDGAHKATIQLLSPQPGPLKPGAPVELEVSVTNQGRARWPFVGTLHPINLGNHWLASDGRVVVQDDARSGVPDSLEPGDTGRFKLAMTAPPKPGSYILELDMVEEGITWFANSGSECLRIPVLVDKSGFAERVSRRRQSSFGHRARHSDTNGAVAQLAMEMHFVPRQDVIATVTEAGGDIARSNEFAGIGDGHVACMYFVRRAPGN